MVVLEELLEENRRITELYVPIIERINRGETGSVDQLDLEPRVFVKRNQDLFFLNALAMRNAKSRYDGTPAFIHPVRVAYWLNKFMERDNPYGDTAMGYGLTHDTPEDAANLNPNEVRIIRGQFGDEFEDELDAAVLGSRPFKPYDFPILGDKLYGITDLTYIAKVLQVTLYGGPAHAAMVIADAIDDLFNLDFLEFIPKDMKSGRIAGYVSRALYSIQELGDRVPELEQPVKEICGAVIEKYHIRKNLVQRRLTGLYEVKHLHGQDPESLEVIKNHIRALGSENLINMI